MRLGQAINYFCRTPVDLFDGKAWHEAEIKGSFESYARNTSQNALGVSRRIFKTPKALGPKWHAIRVPDGGVFLLADYNVDVQGGAAYNHVYQVDEAPFEIKVIAVESDKRASGVSGPTREVVRASTYGNAERVSAVGSSVFEDAEYAKFDIELPAALDGIATSECELDLDGKRFTIDEHAVVGRLLRIVGKRRTA